MSDTPRTDAFMNHIDDSEIDLSQVRDFSADLERENAQQSARITTLTTQLEQATAGLKEATLPAYRAAVEKALAAWDAYCKANIGTGLLDAWVQAMSDLRAVHDQGKTP